jgi:phosphonatase-like hydrolase
VTRISLAVFDVGGTSIRDTFDVPTVFACALQQYGIPTTPTLLQQWRGASKREVITELVRAKARKRSDPERVYLTFQELLIEALGKHGVEAIPGIEDAFHRLRANGCQVFLATGFDARIMDVVISHLNWEEAVDAVVTANDVSRGRPAPDLIYAAMRRARVATVKSVVTVGDTANDLKAAQAAGVGASIGVLTGAHDQEQLGVVSHTVILESAADVPQWLADRQWSAA